MFCRNRPLDPHCGTSCMTYIKGTQTPCSGWYQDYRFCEKFGRGCWEVLGGGIAVDECDNTVHLLLSIDIQLADHKLRQSWYPSGKRWETITLRVSDCNINSAPFLRHLGVQVETRLRFDRHLHLAGKKAVHMISTLSWIMLNIGGPRTKRQTLGYCCDFCALICCSQLCNDDKELCSESNYSCTWYVVITLYSMIPN